MYYRFLFFLAVLINAGATVAATDSGIHGTEDYTFVPHDSMMVSNEAPFYLAHPPRANEMVPMRFVELPAGFENKWAVAFATPINDKPKDAQNYLFYCTVASEPFFLGDGFRLTLRKGENVWRGEYRLWVIVFDDEPTSLQNLVSYHLLVYWDWRVEEAKKFFFQPHTCYGEWKINFHGNAENMERGVPLYEVDFPEEGGPTPVEEHLRSRSKSFTLEQNYPNPFNPETVIRYHLGKASHVSLVVYDITGRQVAQLADEVQPAGSHQASWDAMRLPSGIYFYRLTAGSFTALKRMTLLK